MHPKLQTLLQRQAALMESAPADAHAALPSDPPQPPSFSLSTSETGLETFLDFRFENGDRCAFPYADLISLSLHYEEQRIDLEFPTFMVLVSGAALDELYDLILDRRVRWISEPWPEFQPIPDRPWITEIILQPLDEEDDSPDGEPEPA